MLQFRSPKYEQASIGIPAEVANLQKAFNGSVCSRKGDEYSINNNIIDFLGTEKPPMSWAQTSNHWQITASVYEDIWRKRSISLLTSDEFPIEKEQELLLNWLNPQLDQLYLDVGCSTALYARMVKKKAPACQVVALDFSHPMLAEARIKAEADETNLYFLRTDARYMPFFGATFDGLMMGGTLNELTDPLKVLYECRRVLKPRAPLFMMHLLKADAWYGRLLQGSAEYSGLKFWSIEESNTLFARAGFSIAEQFNKGIVCFSKLLAA